MGRALLLWMLLLGVLATAAAEAPVPPPNSAIVSTSSDPNDWPMYNRDVLGTRHNPAEKSLGKDNVGQLAEKWRFPPADSKESVGVVHATVVVNGHSYFGTETKST